jgi:hypothetical protein
MPHYLSLLFDCQNLEEGEGEANGSGRVRLAGFFPHTRGFFDAPAYDRGGGNIGWADEDCDATVLVAMVASKVIDAMQAFPEVDR